MRGYIVATKQAGNRERNYSGRFNKLLFETKKTLHKNKKINEIITISNTWLHGAYPQSHTTRKKIKMSAIEFIGIYAIGGSLMFSAGWFIGAQRAESEAEKMRRWWFNRENRK